MFSQLIDHTVRIASRSAIAAGVMVVLAATPIQAMAQGNYYCTGHTNTNNGEENGLHDGAFWAINERQAIAKAHQAWGSDGVYVVVDGCFRM